MAAEVNKPDFSYQWSSGGAIVAPSNVKIQTGWTAEVPPFQWENYLQNRQDNAILHLFQKGISEWDAASNYYFTTSGVRSYVQGSDGIIYVAVADSIGQNPTTDVSDTYWKIAFADNSTAVTITSGDARYTQRANNLSDLGNVATARNNLSVYSKPESEALLPLGYFYGFTLANNVTLPNTTIDVGVGQVKTSDNLFSLSLLTPLSGILQASGAWAAGNNQNKLDTGAKANSTTYHVFVIRKTSDGAGDILFSLSATSPTVPSGYAGFRRVGRVATDASGNIRQFKARGHGRYDWVTPSLEFSQSLVGGGTSLITLSGFGGAPVEVIIQTVMQGDASIIRLTTPDQTDAATTVGVAGWTGGLVANQDAVTTDNASGEFNVIVDAASQLRQRTFSTTGAGLTFKGIVFGWREFL